MCLDLVSNMNFLVAQGGTVCDFAAVSSEIALLSKFIISVFGNFQKLFSTLLCTKMIQPWW